jgi:hypothetical protein
MNDYQHAVRYHFAKSQNVAAAVEMNAESGMLFDCGQKQGVHACHFVAADAQKHYDDQMVQTRLKLLTMKMMKLKAENNFFQHQLWQVQQTEPMAKMM